MSADQEPMFRSLYSPETGRIACVLLQAALKGDRQPCHYFGAGDWETGLPDKTFGWVELPRSVWKQIGLMERDERVAFYQHAKALQAENAP